MKVFAAVPALMVLVSLCGSPVPPPPGAVSGAVFYDANRNGIHDSCDSPLTNTQVVVNGPEGKTAIARTDGGGAFQIDDAPVGDGQVTLFTAADLLWPITTDARTVRVESSKLVEGIEIGTASKAVYDRDKITISGVIFNDANSNGVVDTDECALGDYARVLVEITVGNRTAIADGTYELRDLTSASLASFSYLPPALDSGSFPAPNLTPTSGSPVNGTCSLGIVPKPRYSPNTYEANIGLADKVGGRGAITGVVFDDSNGDGVRDSSEPPVPAVEITISRGTVGCFAASSVRAFSDPGGAFYVGNLHEGRYAVDIKGGVLNSEDLVTGGDSLTVEILNGAVHRDIGVQLVPGAFLRIHAFDDANRNGVRDTGEAPVKMARFCLIPANSGPDYPGPNCPQSGTDGIATLGPSPTGDYRLTYDGAFSEFILPRGEPSVDVSLVIGETTDMDFPMEVVTPEEQVIYPGSGEQTLAYGSCYSDPVWVQPPFNDGYKGLFRAPGADQAQKVYLHGIYPVNSKGSFDTAVWLAISGFQIPASGCRDDRPGVFVLTSKAPLDVVTVDSIIIQVRLADAPRLSVINLPLGSGGGAPFYLFVDENYRPIVRCSPYSGCDWNDGTDQSSYYGVPVPIS